MVNDIPISTVIKRSTDLAFAFAKHKFATNRFKGKNRLRTIERKLVVMCGEKTPLTNLIWKESKQIK